MKSVYRFRPCPGYDAERLESWLTDMAAKGLVLSEDGFFMGFAKFDRAEPRERIYRLEAAPRRGGIFDDMESPDDEALELYEELGWHYVDRVGDYFIYYADGGARELNTEPEVQALTMKKLRRGRTFSVVIALAEAVLLVLFYLKYGLLMLAAKRGTLYILTVAALFLLCLAVDVRQAVYIDSLYKRLKYGSAADHGKPWSKGASAYRLRVLLQTALALTVLIWTFSNVVVKPTQSRDSIKDVIDELPYVTLKSMAREGCYEFEDALYKVNNAAERHDPLISVSISSCESADFVTPDGRHINGVLYVDYYEMPNDWLAERMARELAGDARRGRGFSIMDAELPEADFAFACSNYSPQIILRQGSRVIKAQLLQFGQEEIPFEEWSAAAAASIK